MLFTVAMKKNKWHEGNSTINLHVNGYLVVFRLLYDSLKIQKSVIIGSSDQCFGL